LIVHAAHSLDVDRLQRRDRSRFLVFAGVSAGGRAAAKPEIVAVIRTRPAKPAPEQGRERTRSGPSDGRLMRPSTRQEAHMDWNRIEGNWKQFKGKIKEKWGDLTDDDIDRMEGNREQFEGKIQEKYGIGKDQAKRNVEDWLKTLQ
jgi:uncharacterized protein YjbJ (UPF0337 family)